MKKSILITAAIFAYCILITANCFSQGTAINSTGANPDNSAILDASSTTKGALMPRMTTSQMNAIVSPATGLFIYNTDCNTFNYYNGAAWIALGNTGSVSMPGSISGNTSPCQNAAAVAYSIVAVAGATGYNWTVPTGASVASGQGTTSVLVDFGTTSGNICVAAFNACGASNANCLAISLDSPPSTTSPGIHIPGQTNIVWNWTAVSGATGYKWCTVNNYSLATDNGAGTTYNQTGLNCNTPYTLYVWAYNSCGNSAETMLYDTTTACCVNIWTQKTDFGGTARQGAIGLSVGTKGYTGLGWDGSSRKDFWEFDPVTNVWTQKADFGGSPRYGAAGFSIGTKGYVGTGMDGSSYKDFWEWDQTSNIWTRKTDFMGTGRASPAAFSIGTKGYIGVGVDISGATKDFYQWDQATDTWTKMADFGGIARWDVVGFSIGTKGYIGTGYNPDNGTRDFWEWDQAGNTWVQKADFPGTARWGCAGFSIGTKGYIGTGWDKTSNKKDFYEWDQTNNTWTQKADFGGVGRCWAVGFSTGTKGYIGTGSNRSGAYYKDFWEWCQ